MSSAVVLFLSASFGKWCSWKHSLASLEKNSYGLQIFQTSAYSHNEPYSIFNIIEYISECLGTQNKTI